jgi:serine/threonine-protein phosphatase 2A activator
MAAAETFLDGYLPEVVKGARVELLVYLSDSFGSNVRLDFGTGHELAFMWFLWGLVKLGVVGKDDLEQLVHHVFYDYIHLTRRILNAYRLEPAGSQGVWGLDDHYFLSFLLGAAEMCNHPEMVLPSSITDEKLVKKHAPEFMYAGSVHYVMQTKTGAPLSATSPTLVNISGALSWEKVTQGMVKMYAAEVLGKHPVIKHAFFGTIHPFQ